VLKNYLKIAIRNILRNKTYSLINVIGLAVGVACAITLYLFITDELSYDKFNNNADQIYRVYVKMLFNGKESVNAKTSAPLGAALVNNFPEVLNYTRIGFFGNHVFKYKNKEFREWKVYTADSTFFEIFTMNFLAGNSITALNQPNSMVITESAAGRYFGNENPVGKTLNEEGVGSFIITGLIKDFPKNSHFSCDFLLSMSTYQEARNQKWLSTGYSTYIKLKKGTDPVVLENKFKKIVRDYVGPAAAALLGISLNQFLDQGNSYDFLLQPLTSIYLESKREYGIDPNTEWSDVKSSDIAFIYIFSAVGLAILFVAIINFMNLSTARSGKRSKEVGIRKTLGSNKLKLIMQFITESILMSAISVILALALLEVILPVFNNLSGKELKLNLFSNPYAIPSLIGFILSVGILAGSYPAFYLSSFQPVQILKPYTQGRNRKNLFRSTLVIIQFSVSISLLIGTLIIKNQLTYLQNKDLGFNKEHLILIKNAAVLGSKIETFKNELTKNHQITSLGYSSLMFSSGIPGSAYLFDKKTGANPLFFQVLDVDYGFLNTFRIELLDGRFFSKEFPSDSVAVVINQAALKEIGTDHPVGKDLNFIGNVKDQVSYKIIGVIKDFNYESLHQQVRPLVLQLHTPRQAAYLLTLRVISNNPEDALGYIKNTWQKFAGKENINFGFMDQDLTHLYDSEEKTGIVAAIFSFLAIFIACLGLFGLAAFVTEQRTKEIGIRKALGASVSEIVIILSKQFTKWVVFANLIAWPVAYYIMNKWLENFAYRIELNLWVFVLSGLSALLIALITISFHAVKAATANPIKSLKYE
jgi:putative ABC transport system permease protein